MVKLYWLSDGEWARIEPLLPRGRRGAHRVDDRRVISGIMHMLHSGARWRDCPAAYGPVHDNLQPLQPMEPARHLDRHVLRLTGSTGMMGTVAVDSTHIKADRSAAGAKGGPSVMPSGARAAAGRPRSTP